GQDERLNWPRFQEVFSASLPRPGDPKKGGNLPDDLWKNVRDDKIPLPGGPSAGTISVSGPEALKSFEDRLRDGMDRDARAGEVPPWDFVQQSLVANLQRTDEFVERQGAGKIGRYVPGVEDPLRERDPNDPERKKYRSRISHPFVYGVWSYYDPQPGVFQAIN